MFFSKKNKKNETSQYSTDQNCVPSPKTSQSKTTYSTHRRPTRGQRRPLVLGLGSGFTGRYPTGYLMLTSIDGQDPLLIIAKCRRGDMPTALFIVYSSCMRLFTCKILLYKVITRGQFKEKAFRGIRRYRSRS